MLFLTISNGENSPTIAPKLTKKAELEYLKLQVIVRLLGQLSRVKGEIKGGTLNFWRGNAGETMLAK